MKKLLSVVFSLLLVSVMSVSAFAAGSVVAPIIVDYDGGSVTITTDTNTNEITYTAEAKDGYNFVGWRIAGDYEIVEGSLDSNVITVRFLDGSTAETADVEPTFEKIDDVNPTEPTTVPQTTKPGQGPVAPKTGDSLAVAFLALAAVGGIVVAKKKLSK